MNINNFSNHYSNNSKPSFGANKKLPMPDSLPAEAFVFPLLCGYHAYEDYRKAPEETKREILTMRLFVLAGTSIGAFLGHKVFNKIVEKDLNVENFKKLNLSPQQEHIVRIKKMKSDIISSIGIPLGGILGGFTAGSFAEGFTSFVLPPQRKNVRKKQESKYQSLRFLNANKKESEGGMSSKLRKVAVILTTVAGAATGHAGYLKWAHSGDFQHANYTKHAKNVLNAALAGVGAVVGLITGDLLFKNKATEFDKKTIENTDFVLSEMSNTVSAFDSVSDEHLKDRVQKGFYGIISSVVVPSAIVLPSIYGLKLFMENDAKFDKYCSFLKHISTNKTTQKVIFEKSISVPLSVATYYAGDMVGNWVDAKITQRFMEQKFWAELEKRKQKALEESMQNLQQKDNERLQKSLEELAKFEQLAQEARKVSESDSGTTLL